MNKPELLAPAGSFEIGKAALYGGADAIYLALESFGARAYAKNFSISELCEIIKIAHTLNKKVYVTVNTIIKNSELYNVYDFIDELYTLGVDAIICADIAVFMYVINNCQGMECHISTQVGVKDLSDTLFFEKIGANRVVLARENSLEQIKEIKENSNIELEVFIHGALCVSYSGGCLFSSLLSLRSGNRGRCSQNCRREYVIYQNDKPITKPGFYLSMKDLCVGEKVEELVGMKIDSLKIEGRMKNISYVDTICKYYRNLLDNEDADFSKVNQIFHRQYTKGFIFNEDRKNIATITDSSSQGKLIGKVLKADNNKILVECNTVVQKGERLRFLSNDESTYITVSEIYDLNNKKIESSIGKFYLESNCKILNNSLVYKMNDNSLNDIEVDSNVIGLDLYINGYINKKLSITIKINDDYINVESDNPLIRAEKNPINEELLFRQLNKLNDTPFYIESMMVDIENNLFISVSEINKLRRKMVEIIYDLYKLDRSKPQRNKLFLKKRIGSNDVSFVAHVETYEQYRACKDLGISTIFYNNISPYVNSKYHEINEYEVLVSNYGGLSFYDNKIITTDYSFNVMNKDSILHLLNLGAAHVTLSYEVSFFELKEISTDFYNTYGAKAPIDMIIYGRQKLMTMKYCPLKKLGLCGKCQSNNYYLVDKLGRFLLKTRNDCFVEIYNDLPLNLIENLNELKGYVDRFRFEFTNETYDEVVNIINNAFVSLNNNDHKFKIKNQTKGYFKRPII